MRFYTVVSVLCADCWKEGCSRKTRRWSKKREERVRERHLYYAALRKDCRGRLPFIRGKHGVVDKLLLHVRSPLHRDWIDRGSRKIGKRRMGREEKGGKTRGKGGTEQKEEGLPSRDDVKLVLRGLPTSARVVALSTPDIFRLSTKIDSICRVAGNAPRTIATCNLPDVTFSDISPFLREDILRGKCVRFLCKILLYALLTGRWRREMSWNIAFTREWLINQSTNINLAPFSIII